VLGTVAEPAPYDLPPVDLFGWRIMLLAREGTIDRVEADEVYVRSLGTAALPVSRTASEWARNYDYPARAWGRDLTPISWADKDFEFLVARQQASGPSPSSR